MLSGAVLLFLIGGMSIGASWCASLFVIFGFGTSRKKMSWTTFSSRISPWAIRDDEDDEDSDFHPDRRLRAQDMEPMDVRNDGLDYANTDWAIRTRRPLYEGPGFEVALRHRLPLGLGLR